MILLLLIILWLVGVPAYAWTQIARVDAAPSGQRPADQPGKTFLLVGSDSRAGLSKAEQKLLGTGNTAGQRTDTIMLIYVPPSGKPALGRVLLSVARDPRQIPALIRLASDTRRALDALGSALRVLKL